MAGRKKVVHRRKVMGKGAVGDALGNIPLLGALLGPLARMFGGKVRRVRKSRK